VVLRGLTFPTSVRFAPDGRVFVAEKSGLIKVFDGLGDRSPRVFADLRTQVFNYWDSGLLGLALSPDFGSHPFVYALYTADASVDGSAPKWGKPGMDLDPCPSPPGPVEDGCPVSGRLSRFPAGGATAGPEQLLIHDWCQQFPGHSIGALAFGPDGALYVSGGDGARFSGVDYGQHGGSAGSPVDANPCGDPPGGRGGEQAPPDAEGGALRSQDLVTPADRVGYNGTILRLDPATGAAASGNPLASGDPRAARVVAYGFRNPFRVAIRPGTNDLWVGDVGSDVSEEIDRVPDAVGGPVPNFGWPCYEGAAPQAKYQAAGLALCQTLYDDPASTTAPVLTYGRLDQVIPGEDCRHGGSALSGMAFYEGGTYPARFDGALFFADHARGCIWAMLAGTDGAPDPARIVPIEQSVRPVDLVGGPGGDIFYADFEAGSIHRLSYAADHEERWLSDETPLSGSNGSGPLERNMSNGSSAARDGQQLRLGGTPYLKGLGMATPAELRYAIDGCTRFQAVVGIDDRTETPGAAAFVVHVDGKRKLRTGRVRASGVPRVIDLDVSGGHVLTLRVRPTPDGRRRDMADWADARLICPAGAGRGTQLAAARFLEVRKAPHGVSVALMNADTIPDLIAANAADNSVSVLLGKGGGQFEAAQTFATGVRPKVAVAADVNHDGFADVVTADQNENTVGVLLGRGDGTLRGVRTFPACARPHDVAIGDVDGDHDPDLAVACFGTSQISVLMGRGDGTFERQRRFPAKVSPHALVMRDFDGDTHLDIAVADHGSHAVSVLVGVGDGTFEQTVNFGVGDGPHSVQAADLDEDGFLDLVTANDRSADVSVLIGKGDGSFEAAVAFPAGSVPKSVAVGDVDGDGHLDVIAADTAGNYEDIDDQPGGDLISVLPGDGDGGFGPRRTFYVGPGPFSVVAADLDGNGRTDIAVADFATSHVAVLLNRSQ
jgi:glucose/arabinose dehydrogenase